MCNNTNPHKPRPNVSVFNPTTFKPADHLPHGLWPYAEHARMLMHLVEMRRTRHHLDEPSYVPMKASILRKLIHERMEKPLRHALIAAGALECDFKYAPGVKCYGYRWGEKFRRAPLEKVPIRDANLIKKHAKAPAVEIGNEVHAHLWRWLQQVEVDYDKAQRVINPTGRNLHEKWISLEMLHDGQLFFCSDERGRVYHNVCSLWGELRQFLRINGQRLFNIDIKNSQPLLFCILLQQYLQTQQERQCTLLPTPIYYNDAQWNVQLQEHERTHPSSHSIYYNDAQHIAPDDAQQFIAHSQNGTVYECIMEQFGIPITKKSRRRFKTSFFASIFFSRLETNRRYTKLFRQHFPTVDEAIRYYKHGDYKDLALTLQRTEAELMIGHVCRMLMQRNPGIPLVTIHDSILTTRQYTSSISSAIEEAFSRYHMRPTVECTAY